MPRNAGPSGSNTQGAEVLTGVFLSEEYAGLSGLLCSRIDVANRPDKIGADFQLVENRWARAPMPDLFRLKGTFSELSGEPRAM
jgi:hypothetical protein